MHSKPMIRGVAVFFRLLARVSSIEWMYVIYTLWRLMGMIFLNERLTLTNAQRTEFTAASYYG